MTGGLRYQTCATTGSGAKSREGFSVRSIPLTRQLAAKSVSVRHAHDRPAQLFLGDAGRPGAGVRSEHHAGDSRNTSRNRCVECELAMPAPAGARERAAKAKAYESMGVWYQTPMNVPGQIPFNPTLTGTTGTTINDIIWNFFKSHSR